MPDCNVACAPEQVRKLAPSPRSSSPSSLHPTLSLQSLCYNIPYMEALASDQEACAVYIFPTKALAQVCHEC